MTDLTLIREVSLCIVNDGSHYTQQITPVIRNLARKIRKGNYDNILARKLWNYVADEGVKRYSVAHMGHKRPTLTIMNKADRAALAVLLAEHYSEELAQEAGVDHVLV